MDHVAIQAVAAGPARQETLMGRPHTVVPAVLVQEQVLSNNLGRTYLPASAITQEWADTANGAPVVMDHPRIRGVAVSARSTDVLNALGVGVLMNVKADGTQLKGDVYLDDSRAEAVDGFDVVLERALAGKAGELSTGFPVQAIQENGVFGGEEYDLRIEPRGFDHLAVFAEKTGACSVSDGCGLGVNHAGPCSPPEADLDATGSGGPTAWWAWFRKMILGANQSDNDTRSMLQDALSSEFGTASRWVWVVDVFSLDGVVVWDVENESGERQTFRASFDIESGVVSLGEPEEVTRVTTYEPVANAGDTGRQEMKREDMVAALAEAGPLDAEALNKLSDCDLRALHGARDGGGSDDSDDGGSDALAKALSEGLAAINGRLDKIEAASADVVAQHAERRLGLVKSLSANDRCAFTEDELGTKPVAELEKLASMLRVANYAGRGGPQVFTPGETAVHAPVVNYWDTEPYKAKAAREAN